MNIEINNPETNQHFFNNVDNSECLKMWLINKLTGYNDSKNKRYTLTIFIDNYTKPENGFYSYNWGISFQEIDPVYGDLVLNDKYESLHHRVMNGGLVYRGIETKETIDDYGDIVDKADHVYSSHT